jgi:hypothetical protein
MKMAVNRRKTFITQSIFSIEGKYGIRAQTLHQKNLKKKMVHFLKK